MRKRLSTKHQHGSLRLLTHGSISPRGMKNSLRQEMKRKADAFGLAIAIFQLLTMGRNPFVGSYSEGDTTIQRNIAEFRFAYSR